MLLVEKLFCTLAKGHEGDHSFHTDAGRDVEMGAWCRERNPQFERMMPEADFLIECTIYCAIEEARVMPQERTLRLLVAVARDWLEMRNAARRHDDHSCYERLTKDAPR